MLWWNVGLFNVLDSNVEILAYAVPAFTFTIRSVKR